MPLPKISAARDLNDREIAEQIIALKKQLFQLRLQKATRQLEKPHQIKHTKHQLAQLLTVEHERKLATMNEGQSAVDVIPGGTATPEPLQE